MCFLSTYVSIEQTLLHLNHQVQPQSQLNVMGNIGTGGQELKLNYQQYLDQAIKNKGMGGFLNQLVKQQKPNFNL